jgi:hypothetical protein
VAILPAEVTLSGKLPKNLTPEDIAKQRKGKASIFNMLNEQHLNHANTKKYITTVNFRTLTHSQKILSRIIFSVRDSWKKNDEELAKLLGVDAVIRMNIPQTTIHE